MYFYVFGVKICFLVHINTEFNQTVLLFAFYDIA